MSHPATGVSLKIRRANEHLNALVQERKSFLDTNPHSIEVDFYPEERRYAYRIRIRATPPLRISLLAGECVQNLRSALDHLAWQLAILKHDPPPETTEFPIFRDSTKYARKRRSKIGGIDGPAQALIDAAQPCAGANPERHPLWILHRMANEDKHRFLHVASVLPMGVEFFTDKRIDAAVTLRVGPLEDNTEFAGFEITNEADADMDVNYAMAFDIGFRDRWPDWGNTLVEGLNALGQHIDDLTGQFAHFFR